MERIQEFKCPGCGAKLEFNTAQQNLKCPFCDTEIAIDEVAISESDAQADLWEPMSAGDWKEGETDDMRVYACRSCGGEIIADKSTGAANCPYCGNQVVMKEQFEGDLRPNFIIPFKHDKNAAKAAYRKHLEGKMFLPPFFKSSAHIDELKGIYVPFWLFDADANAQIRYKATKNRIWSDSRYNYRETSYFSVTRSGSLGFEKVPVDGSSKIEDTLMEALEPYDFKDAVDFQTAYLAGYLADKYDVDADESMERANDRVKKSTEQAFLSTVSGYTSVLAESSSVQLHNGNAKYALYPVWLLNTTWKGKKYTFAMNGQTGKMVGDLPMDKGAYNKYLFGSLAIATAVVFALQYLLWLL